MNSEVLDQLRSLGVQTSGLKTGENKVRCPQCSHLRKKKSDRCLSLRIDHDGYVANCWHCGWASGGSETNGRGRRMDAGKKSHKPGDFGQSRRRLQYGVLR